MNSSRKIWCPLLPDKVTYLIQNSFSGNGNSNFSSFILTNIFKVTENKSNKSGDCYLLFVNNGNHLYSGRACLWSPNCRIIHESPDPTPPGLQSHRKSHRQEGTFVFRVCNELPSQACWSSFSISEASSGDIFLQMRLFCLQLEASCLQWSFFAYSCVLDLFYLRLELSLTI